MRVTTETKFRNNIKHFHRQRYVRCPATRLNLANLTYKDTCIMISSKRSA